MIARIGGGDRIAGVAVWWAYGERAARIGLVIVSPDHQGRSIGRSLVERLLADAGSRAVMLLTTEVGRALYQRLGFRMVGESQRHQGIYWEQPTRDPRMRPATADEHRHIVRLDTGAMGGWPTNCSEKLTHAIVWCTRKTRRHALRTSVVAQSTL